jgi:osmotically-inducible protein OsmY
MKFLSIGFSALLTITAMTVTGCSRTDVAKQTPAAEPGTEATADQTTTGKGTQNPGGDPSFQQAQQPTTASGGVIQDNQAHPIDPSGLPTPSNSSQLPRPDLTQGGAAQGGSPVSDAPANVPQRGQGIQVPGGRPPSETPAGNPMGNGADTRKSSVEGALHGKPGFEKVVVSIGNDGCVALNGSVKTKEKKEEATAIARGASGMSCVMNLLTLR